MKADNLYGRFLTLEGGPASPDAINVLPFTDGSPHRFGVSPCGEPVFFVCCADHMSAASVHLRLINVDFNVECCLNTDGVITLGRFCVVRLLTRQADLVRHFVEIFDLSISSLPEKPATEQFAAEVETLVQLFSGLGRCSLSVLQGLWAELFIISRSHNPLQLVRAWHVNANDRFDFNDGTDKIEVKSSSNSGKRIHSFAVEQLNAGQSSNILVASVPVVECDTGITVRDLEDSIVKRLDDLEARIKLKSVILKVVGLPEDCDAYNVGFDSAIAKDGLAFFDSVDIPKIEVSDIPSQVSNVHFSVDLSGVKPVSPTSINSLLFHCL